jgi:hypothetical protein
MFLFIGEAFSKAYLWEDEDEKLPAGVTLVSIEDDEERIPLFIELDVVTRSDEIAIGLSPNILSINHLCGLEINCVELLPLPSVTSENPSDASCFCSRANIIRDTVAAKSPVGQSIRIEMRNGRIKKSDLPTVLSRNSRDFRGAISTKEPNTSRPITDKIFNGECKTECIFVNQDIKVKSISSLATVAFGDVGFGKAFGDVAFGDEALLITGLAILLERQSF